MKETLYGINLRRKDISRFWEIVEEFGFSRSVLERGILQMGERLSQIKEDLGLTTSRARIQGGLIPCLGRDSILHFLKGLIDWDWEAKLDFFGIYYGGEMAQIYLELGGSGSKKRVLLKAYDWVKSDNYAALRLLPTDWDFSLLKKKILVISPSIEENAGRDEWKYTLVSPYFGQAVTVADLDGNKARGLLASEEIDCFIFDFQEV